MKYYILETVLMCKKKRKKKKEEGIENLEVAGFFFLYINAIMNKYNCRTSIFFVNIMYLMRDPEFFFKKRSEGWCSEA